MLHSNRPSPRPDAVSAPFFQGLAQRTLRVQQCVHCGATQLAERRCRQCQADDPPWVPASGRASLFSFAIVHAAHDAAFAGCVPYHIALVELEEGPQIYANVVDADIRELEVGMKLVLRFSALDSGVTVPVFAPADPPPARTRQQEQ